MRKTTLRKILLKAQKLQKESFGERTIVVSAYVGSVAVCVFEKDYDEKEDGDCKNFLFFDWQENMVIEETWNDLMDYYNGQEC